MSEPALFPVIPSLFQKHPLAVTQKFRAQAPGWNCSLALHADTAAFAGRELLPLPCTFPPVSLGWAAAPLSSLCRREGCSAFGTEQVRPCTALPWAHLIRSVFKPPQSMPLRVCTDLGTAQFSDSHAALLPLATGTDVPLLFQPRRQTGLCRAFDLLKALKSIGS